MKLVLNIHLFYAKFSPNMLPIEAKNFVMDKLLTGGFKVQAYCRSHYPNVQHY